MRRQSMLAKIRAERLDVVVASRHTGNGGVGDWQQSRVMISDFASRLGRLIVKADLTDPMSGFFTVERSAFTGAMRQLSGQGFKILLDLFASSPRPLAFGEVPLTFRQRLHGESKLDAMVAWEYVMLLLEKLVGPAVPVRFLLFAMIGGLGIGTHMASLWFGTHVLLAAFALSQAAATVLAMTGNFFLNNLFTYRDRRVAGGGAVPRKARHFLPKHPVPLPRPPVAGAPVVDRADVVLRGVRRRRRRKCRGRRSSRRRPSLLVARRSRRRRRFGGVELRDVIDLHLVAAPAGGVRGDPAAAARAAGLAGELSLLFKPEGGYRQPAGRLI